CIPSASNRGMPSLKRSLPRRMTVPSSLSDNRNGIVADISKTDGFDLGLQRYDSKRFDDIVVYARSRCR
ncbi:hypothetical protein MKL09_22225, partial [Methylobacterium sp. J-048]|uniref:hypothetical protein n=1 Tax=Methylobacterium sp. J-048 TaxID=2836635 RepID=UPI001FBBFC84